MNGYLSTTKLRNLFLQTTVLPKEYLEENDAIFERLASDFFEQAGLTLEWSRASEIHDRYVVFDNGVMFKLGRGLDIFKPALGLANKNQEIRKVRDCTIDVFRVEKKL